MSHATIEAGRKSGIKKTIGHHAAAQQSSREAQREGPCSDRHEQIAVAAYYLAERRGFCGGDPVADWLAAEAEIDLIDRPEEKSAVH